MTDEQKRIHFAGMALVGMGAWIPPVVNEYGMREYGHELTDRLIIDARAEWAVAQADAVIRQLKKAHMEADNG